MIIYKKMKLSIYEYTFFLYNITDSERKIACKGAGRRSTDERDFESKAK